jgi:hypothetical protein
LAAILAEMNFTGPAPGLLPTLAALINVRIPVSFDFSQITIKVIKEQDGEEAEELVRADIAVSKEEKEKALSNVESGEKVAVLTFPVRWSPIEFQKPCFLKVRAYVDGTHEVRAGALRVNFPSNTSTEPGTS